MDSRSQAPHKSSSFSSATTRDDGGSRSREVDPNLSLGAVRQDKRDQHHHGAAAGSAAHREQSIKEENEEEEEEGDAGGDLAALSAEVDKFIAGGHDGDAPVTDATLERFAAAVERAIARSESAEDRWAADGGGLLAAITRVATLSSALGKSPAEGKHGAAAHRIAAAAHLAMAFLEDEFHALLEDPRVAKPVEQGAAHEADQCVLRRRRQDVQTVGGIAKVQVSR